MECLYYYVSILRYCQEVYISKAEQRFHFFCYLFSWNVFLWTTIKQTNSNKQTKYLRQSLPSFFHKKMQITNCDRYQIKFMTSLGPFARSLSKPWWRPWKGHKVMYAKHRTEKEKFQGLAVSARKAWLLISAPPHRRVGRVTSSILPQPGSPR